VVRRRSGMAISLKETTSATFAAAGAGLVIIIATAALSGCSQAKAGGPASGVWINGAHAVPSRNGSSTAVGSQAHAAGAPMKPASACAAQAAVKSVRVTRLPTLTQLGQTKPLWDKLPGITVGDPAKARALARLICGLPAMPKGILSCPADVGGWAGGYQLVFVAGGRHLAPVTVRASGCETVTGAGPGEARWAGRTPGFWTTLSRLTGIRAPAHSP
jgi:hypothetical protein